MSIRVFSTKEVSDYFSVTKKTIRHYYKKGLIKPSYVDGNGYWYFNQDDLDRIELIQKLKSFKFQLNEIKDILNSKDFDVESLIENRRKKIEREIEELTLAKKGLLGLEEKEFNLKNVDKVIENTHDDWIKKYYSKSDYDFLMKMMVGSTAYEDHKKIFLLFREINFSLESCNDEMFENKTHELLDILSLYYANVKDIKRAIVLQLDIMRDGPDFMSVFSENTEKVFREYIDNLVFQDITTIQMTN